MNLLIIFLVVFVINSISCETCRGDTSLEISGGTIKYNSALGEEVEPKIRDAFGLGNLSACGNCPTDKKVYDFSVSAPLAPYRIQFVEEVDDRGCDFHMRDIFKINDPIALVVPCDRCIQVDPDHVGTPVLIQLNCEFNGVWGWKENFLTRGKWLCWDERCSKCAVRSANDLKFCYNP